MRREDVRRHILGRVLWMVLLSGFAFLVIGESFDENTFYVLSLLEFLSAAVLVIMYPSSEET